jgi:hypothetical protein
MFVAAVRMRASHAAGRFRSGFASPSAEISIGAVETIELARVAE